MNTPLESSTDASQFWAEAKRRRNHFFLTWIGWLPAAAVLIPLYMWLLPDTPGWQNFAMFMALATWFAFWYWVARRLSLMRCYNCGKQAFSTPYFFMRHAKCQNCGARASGA
jgi:hypothetical protein